MCCGEDYVLGRPTLRFSRVGKAGAEGRMRVWELQRVLGWSEAATEE